MALSYSEDALWEIRCLWWRWLDTRNDRQRHGRLMLAHRSRLYDACTFDMLFVWAVTACSLQGRHPGEVHLGPKSAQVSPQSAQVGPKSAQVGTKHAKLAPKQLLKFFDPGPFLKYRSRYTFLYIYRDIYIYIYIYIYHRQDLHVHNIPEHRLQHW